jgi:hypothetical protein
MLQCEVMLPLSMNHLQQNVQCTNGTDLTYLLENNENMQESVLLKHVWKP